MLALPGALLALQIEARDVASHLLGVDLLEHVQRQILVGVTVGQGWFSDMFPESDQQFCVQRI